MATVTSVQDGSWSDASTWNSGSVPTASDTVIIEHKITIPGSITVDNIQIRDNGSLTVSPTFSSIGGADITADRITMDRVLNDTREVRLDAFHLDIAKFGITCYGTYGADGFPTTNALLTSSTQQILVDDPGVFGHTSQMQDIKPEGCGKAYSRKQANGVRYLTMTMHIKATATGAVYQLYQMAEGPFQVLAVTPSAIIKGYIETITFDQASVGKAYRTFKITIAEGERE